MHKFDTEYSIREYLFDLCKQTDKHDRLYTVDRSAGIEDCHR